MAFPEFRASRRYTTISPTMFIIDMVFLAVLAYVVLNGASFQAFFAGWYFFATVLGFFMVVVPDRAIKDIPTWHYELLLDKYSRPAYNIYQYGYEFLCAFLLFQAQYWYALVFWFLSGVFFSTYKTRIKRVVETRGNAPDTVQNLSRIAKAAEEEA